MGSSEEWSSIGAVSDPELQQLSSSLVQTALKSKAPATSRKYLYALERWRRWADEKVEISSFPVLDWQLALYLQHIANTIKSLSAVEEAVNAVSWLHEVSCIPPFPTHPL